MSSALKRLSSLAAQFAPSSASSTTPGPGKEHPEYQHRHHVHQLSPTIFLPRAAAVEPDAPAIYHIAANGQEHRRSYRETADRSRGFAYYLRKQELKRVGILATNTPAFFESIFAIGAAGGINVAINYRLKKDDIEYIFDHAEVDAILVDQEVLHLLDDFRQTHPKVAIIVDADTNGVEGQYDRAVLEGLAYDDEMGGRGWDGLETEVLDEESIIALSYTSGTTSRPKSVIYTHRSAYLASVGNVIESGLNTHNSKADRCHYLWTLPMFHAMGWTFPWAVTAVRGTHYCLRKVDYPEIWRLLKTEQISHYNSAPTVNTLLCADPNAEKLTEPVRVTVAASPPTAHLFETMENLNLRPVHVYGLTETYGPITKGYHMPAWQDLPTKEKYGKMARQGWSNVVSLPCRVIKAEKDESASGWGGVADKLVDVEKNGQEIGEICFIGNICARGYYKDPEATKKLFAGGVLHTGDLAVWHPDGAIQILDRAKDIIISGGENISSLSVESMLVTHPDILEAAVVALQHEKWGETPKAFITVKQGRSGSLTGQEIIEWAKNRSNISRFMVPSEIEIVEELPKTSTGKLRKNVLREWAKGGSREEQT